MTEIEVLSKQILNTNRAGIVQRISEFLIILAVLFICFLTLPFSFLMSVKFVKIYERIVVFRLGRILPYKSTRPGTTYLIPFIDHYHLVDLRLLTFQIQPQSVLTKDSVTITVDAIVFYRISNAIISLVNIENVHSSTNLLAQTTLRNMIGTHTMYEILTDRKRIAQSMETVLDSISYEWGIKIERVELKDVSLPKELQKALAAEAEATRNARAKIVTAEGELKASVNLKNAASIMSQSNASKHAIQLRYFQTLNTISSSSKNSTLVFPFPSYLMNMLPSFKKNHSK